MTAPPGETAGSVLMVANYAPDAGYAWWLMENFWVELAELARAAGLHPILVYPEHGPIPDLIMHAGIELQFVPFLSGSATDWFALMQLVRRRRVRVVYLSGHAFRRPAYLVLRALGVRCLINHDHSPGDRPPSRGVKGAIKALLNRLPPLTCDAHLCVSPLIGQRAITNMRIPAPRLHVVQNGIRPLRPASDPQYLATLLGESPARRLCVTVCRAHPYKRVHVMLDVAHAYVAGLQRDDLTFVHCGDGPELEALAARAAALGLGDRVRFLGRRDDIADILRSAHFALHPAQGEGFSLAILEYMSAALATFVPDIPSVAQAIEHQQSGYVYPDGDVQGIAQGLAHLVDHEAERRRIGEAAALAVSTRYSLEAMNAQFRAVVAPLLPASS